MPRVDPLQSKKYLSISLSSEGGINSREEIPRFISLMKNSSKKIVCTSDHLLVLKRTEETLLDMFMTSGGWHIIHTWLQESMVISNWNLVREILELLLMTPVDSTRLRSNLIPKLVKTLSKREELGDIKEMATSLVNNWLVIVKKEETEKVITQSEEIEQPSVDYLLVTKKNELVDLPDKREIKMEVDADNTTSSRLYHKITVKEGKLALINSEVREDKVVEEFRISEETVERKDGFQKCEVKNGDESEKEIKPKSNNDVKYFLRNRSTDSSKDEDKNHSTRYFSKKSSSSTPHNDEKSLEQEVTIKDKYRNNGSTKHISSSNSKSYTKNMEKKDFMKNCETQAQKDKNTLEELISVKLKKFERIPKKTPSHDTDTKKEPSNSFENEKKVEDNPEFKEEPRSPLSRSAVPNSPVAPPRSSLATKRRSPSTDMSTPPEKKLKLKTPERIGAIKLIPPKPIPFLQSLRGVTSTVAPKKTDGCLSQSEKPEETTPSIQQRTSSPIGIKNYSSANFSQKGLDNTHHSEEYKNKTEEAMKENNGYEKTKKAAIEKKDNKTNSENISEVSKPSTRTNSEGLKGALVYFKTKGPKCSIRWKNDKDSVDARNFELNKSKRTNISKLNSTEFTKLYEAESLSGQHNEDSMKPFTSWKIPYLVEQPDLPVEPGSKSLEIHIQYDRTKHTSQISYFRDYLIPDTPAEPFPEIHPITDPIIIPLDDPESPIIDLTNTWPEPKEMTPPEQPPIMQSILQKGPFPNFEQMGAKGFAGPQGLCIVLPNMVFNGPVNVIPNYSYMTNNPKVNMKSPMDTMNQTPKKSGPMNQGSMIQGLINSNRFLSHGRHMDGFNPMKNENKNFSVPFNQPINNNFNMERGRDYRGWDAVRREYNNWNRNTPRGPANLRPNYSYMMENPKSPMDTINQTPKKSGPMNQGSYIQGLINSNMFLPHGRNMDGFNPMINENKNYSVPFNQPINNNFNMEGGRDYRGWEAVRREYNNWNRNTPRGPANVRPNYSYMMENPKSPMDTINQTPKKSGPMNQGSYIQGLINSNMFLPHGRNMDGFNPMINENKNYSVPFNQPINNNFNMEGGRDYRGWEAVRREYNNWNRNTPRGPANVRPNYSYMMKNLKVNMKSPMDTINQTIKKSGPMNQGSYIQGLINSNIFLPHGRHMDGFNSMINENENYSVPFNQPINNNINMQRGRDNRGWDAVRREYNNWNRNTPRGGTNWRGNCDHKGSGTRKNVKNHGHRRKIGCGPFVHSNSRKILSCKC